MMAWTVHVGAIFSCSTLAGCVKVKPSNNLICLCVDVSCEPIAKYK